MLQLACKRWNWFFWWKVSWNPVFLLHPLLALNALWETTVCEFLPVESATEKVGCYLNFAGSWVVVSQPPEETSSLTAIVSWSRAGEGSPWKVPAGSAVVPTWPLRKAQHRLQSLSPFLPFPFPSYLFSPRRFEKMWLLGTRYKACRGQC